MGDSAASANKSFHDAYDDARSSDSLEVPVLVVLEDELVLVHAGKQTRARFTPDAFNTIKSVAHVPVAVFAACHRVALANRLDRRVRKQLESLRARVTPLAGALRDDPALPEKNLRRVISKSGEFIDAVLAADVVESSALREFAEALGPLLLECTEDGTRRQLEALDAHVSAVLASLAPEDAARVEVVVSGAHQARVRSLAMQYFEKRFGEPPGCEERVTYGERVREVDEAVALVGTQRLDRAIAEAFFGDAKRLQRDILGDAATRQLVSFRPGQR